MGIGFLLYSFFHVPVRLTPAGMDPGQIKLLTNLGNGIGAATFIVAALTFSKGAAFLKTKPIAFLGKISYSVYLFHYSVLFLCLNLFYESLPHYLVLGIAFIATMAISSLSYYLVELPSIRFGKVIVNKMSTVKSRLKSPDIPAITEDAS